MSRILVAAFLLTATVSSAAAKNECLVRFDGLGDAVANGGTVECTDCDPTCDTDGVTTPNGSCTFQVRVCADDADAACAATELRPVRVRGKCDAAALAFTPAGTAPSCGSSHGLSVTIRKKARKAVCKVTASTRSSGRPRRADKDLLKLVCRRRKAGESCPTTTTTTPVSTTTTTTFCDGLPMVESSQCAPIVVGQPIANSYKLESTSGEKRCVTTSLANRFGPCTTDADCGGTVGGCLELGWVTAAVQVMPSPPGSQTTFTVARAGAFPTCEHAVCVPCGNPHASCPGLAACEVAGNPSNCVPRGTQGCCDHPGFIVPNLFINILGGLCSRVDQIACGTGVVNTSNPQTGDNEVTKTADTSDPGPDCIYGTADDPPPLACNVAGNDANGQIVRTVGNGTADADGIHFRLTTPELSTTWADRQSPQGTCAPDAAFDQGETLISQLVLKAEPTTAGASGAYVDRNGDACARSGFGFGGVPDGPITVDPSPGPARPQPYDGSAGSVSTAVSEVFSGEGSPLKDLGFVAITPNLPVVVVPAVNCCCSDAPGCPE